MIRNMLDHPLIQVELDTPFSRAACMDGFDHVFYTGPLDGFFNYEFGRLPYRSLRFEDFRVDGDFQPSAVVNYPDATVPYTRITEHKKFMPWETFERSLCSREYSFECGPDNVPYYPVNLVGQSKLLDRYRDESSRLEGVSFVGRLATFRYLDMDVAISEALEASRVTQERLAAGVSIPAFFNAD